MSQEEPLASAGESPDAPEPAPKAAPGASPAAAAMTVPPSAPKSNPINMALLELQGDVELPMDPVPPPAPAAPILPPFPVHQQPPEPPPARIMPATVAEKPAPFEKPVMAEKPAAPEQGTVAAARTHPANEPQPAPLKSPAPVTTPAAAARSDQPKERLHAPLTEPIRESHSAIGLLPMILASALVSLICTLLGSLAYDLWLRGPSHPADATQTASNTSPDEDKDNDALKTKIGKLENDVDRLQKELEEKSNGAAAVALAPVEKKLADIENATSKQAHDQDGRIESILASIKALKDEQASREAAASRPPADTPKAVADVPKPPAGTPSGDKPATTEGPARDTSVATATPSPVRSPSSAVVPTSASPTISEGEKRDNAKPLLEDIDSSTADDSAAALKQGLDLFKNRKYPEANAYFSKLVQSNPTDARIWYYAALSRGCATGEWQNAREFVAKGLEREKAGTPKTPIIDNAVSDLTSDTGKEWLKWYRDGKMPKQ